LIFFAAFVAPSASAMKYALLIEPTLMPMVFSSFAEAGAPASAMALNATPATRSPL
jgi:hypothetical protein